MSWYCSKCDKNITNVSTKIRYQCELGNECGARLESLLPGGITHTFRDPLLVERQKTHGDFHNNAQISQEIKRIFARTQIGYADAITNPVYLEALDMIALKLSRILSGQADFKDHWDDIAGYAKLASEACQKS